MLATFTEQKCSTGWRFVRLGIPFTRIHPKCTKSYTPIYSKFPVNRAKILNCPVWTKCQVKFFSQSKICLVPWERSLLHFHFVTYVVALYGAPHTDVKHPDNNWSWRCGKLLNLIVTSLLIFSSITLPWLHLLNGFRFCFVIARPS